MMYGALICLQLLCLLNVASIGKYEQSDFIRLESKVQSDKSIDEILQSWCIQSRNFQSYYFEVAIEEEGSAYKIKQKSTCRIAVMLQPNGNCWVKVNLLDSHSQLARTYIFRDKTLINMDYADKRMYITERDRTFTRISMVDISDMLLSAIPFFITEQEELKKRYETSLIQKDADYTWIKFEPRTDNQRRFMDVGQMGIVNYDNTVSQKHFPLQIMWREPGGNIVAWKFTKVVTNDTTKVEASNFLIDQERLSKDGWKVILDKDKSWFSWFMCSVR